MLHIATSIYKIDNDKYIENIEAVFEINKDTVAKHPELSGVLYTIDQSTYLGDELVKTKFGLTTLSNISSGCKTLLLALIFPDYWIDFLDAGINVLDYAIQISKNNEMRIVTHGDLLDSIEDTEVELDGNIISATKLYDFTCRPRKS